jgi:predicted dehydrogenase
MRPRSYEEARRVDGPIFRTEKGRIVKWGLVGTSTIARDWTTPAIAAQPEKSIVAIATSNAERGKQLSNEVGFP